MSSFLRTVLAGFRPRRFWTSLFPTQPSSPKRLIAYWMGAAAVLVFAAAVGLALNIVGITIAGAGYYVGPAAVQKCADVSIRNAFRDVCTSEIVQLTIWGAVVVPVIWPWLCWAVSLIFRISMRRARIRPIHLLRVCIYSCDLAFWWGLFILAAALAPVPFLGVTSSQWMVALYQTGGA